MKAGYSLPRASPTRHYRQEIDEIVFSCQLLTQPILVPVPPIAGVLYLANYVVPVEPQVRYTWFQHPTWHEPINGSYHLPTKRGFAYALPLAALVRISASPIPLLLATTCRVWPIQTPTFLDIKKGIIIGPDADFRRASV